ncbi:hypothetical protein P7C71_g3727, partial [Lecanoromycetidae sp. Uapishka_2]
MDHLQSNIFIAGQRLNDLTGYSGIEALKKDIEEQGSQREVNELLQRKHAWTPNDLERFTELYRSDHANEQAETAAQENLMAIERRAEEAGARLSACILARYHEEQIWSDKIRRMSTWGTWGLMGINILLFVVFQIGVEPWRRRRLVKGFEEKVMEALEREGSGSSANSVDVPEVQDLSVRTIEAESTPIVEAKESPPGDELPVSQITSDSSSTEVESLRVAPQSKLGSLRGSLADMFSERQITIRQVDLTTAMLEGTAAGVAFVGMVVLCLRPR